jgi:predicted metalloprotease with PDZ domain
MKLRGITAGQKGLDDVHRDFYEQYKGNNDGYTEEDFILLCRETGGEPMADFIDLCVNRKTPLPYNPVSSACGFVIEKLPGRTLAFMGVQTEDKTIVRIIPESPAEAAGLQKHDEIYAIGSYPLFRDLHYLLYNFRPGERISVSVLRGGKAFRYPLTLGSQTIYRFIFEEKHTNNGFIETIRKAFYTGKTE